LKEYSDLVINLLPYIVEEDYFFIVQWDGFITHPDRWEDIFFSYDYIGAPWIRNNLPIELDTKFSSVGNGGFSFRSRKLLDASKRIPVLIDECFPQGHAEDVALCLRYRQQLTDLGILFANEEVADRFSTELDTARPRLGFHGVPNLPLFLSDDEMIINITELLLRTHNNVSLCLLFIKLFETQRADVYQNLFDWCVRDKVKFTGLTSILECSKVKIPLFSANIYF
jgi:hypothetical protein